MVILKAKFSSILGILQYFIIDLQRDSNNGFEMHYFITFVEEQDIMEHVWVEMTSVRIAGICSLDVSSAYLSVQETIFSCPAQYVTGLLM